MSLNEGKTIILTTHYIEEARRSNTVGKNIKSASNIFIVDFLL